MTMPATQKTLAVSVDPQKAMAEGAEQVAEGFKAAATFSKGNIEAFVKLSKIATESAQNISAELVDYSKRSYEVAMAAAQEIYTCTTLGAFIEKQSEFGKVSMEGLAAETAKLNDMLSAAAKKWSPP